MRTKLLLLSLAVLVGLVACQPYPTDGTSVVVVNTNTQTQSPGNPGASPSPGTGAPMPPGARVAIFVLGQTVAGVQVEKTPLKVGGKQVITATPKMPDGTDISPLIHGSDCEWRVSDESMASIDVSGDNEFNIVLKGNAPGRVLLTATVKGVTGSLSMDVVP